MKLPIKPIQEIGGSWGYSILSHSLSWSSLENLYFFSFFYFVGNNNNSNIHRLRLSVFSPSTDFKVNAVKQYGGYRSEPPSIRGTTSDPTVSKLITSL